MRAANVWRAGYAAVPKVLAKAAPPRAALDKKLPPAELATGALRAALDSASLLPHQVDRFLVISDRQVVQPMPAFAPVLQHSVGGPAWGAATLDIHTQRLLSEADAAEIAGRYIRGGLSEVVAVVTVNTRAERQDSVVAQILARDDSAARGAMFQYAGLADSEVFFPGDPITNAMISQRLLANGVPLANAGPDFYNKTIRARVGIETRHHALPTQTVSDLGVEVILKLVRAGKLDLTKVAAIVACSSNMNSAINNIEDPGNTPVGDAIVADLLQHGLPADVHTAHLSAACASGSAGLEYGGLLYRIGEDIGIGPEGLVVVVASEIYSRILDPQPKGSPAPNFVFGDGAGVYILRRTQEGFGILASNHVGDGSQADIIDVKNGRYFRMLGPRVNAFGATVVPRVVNGVHNALEMMLGDYPGDIFAPHNANRETMEAALRDTGTIRKDIADLVAQNLLWRGNTSGGSVFTASHEHRRGQPIPSGARISLVGFGAGMQVAMVTNRGGGFV